MTAPDILRAARALIAEPASWTQHTSARNRTGAPTHPRYAGAVCWCAIGAVVAVTPNRRKQLAALRLLGQPAATGEFFLSVWNDSPERTHAEVLAAFDRAIVLAEAQQ